MATNPRSTEAPAPRAAGRKLVTIEWSATQSAPPPHPRRSIPKGMGFSAFVADDGWALRSFSWPQTGTPRGSLLFLGGRGDFVEKYLEPLRHWHDGGWAITGFDWRGQGGSGRFLADPTICHTPDFERMLADLAAFVDRWIAETPPPRVIVAHSMGGHFALRHIAKDARGIDAVVLASPMIGIGTKGVSTLTIGLAARAAGLLGQSERRVWTGDAGDAHGRMTSCPERHADKIWWKTTRPEIASGAPSWGWVRAACASIGKLPARKMTRIATPVLLFVSREDPIIDVAAVRRAARHLPGAEIEIYEGTSHELLREADARRMPVLARIDAFLVTHAGRSSARSAD